MNHLLPTLCALLLLLSAALAGGCGDDSDDGGETTAVEASEEAGNAEAAVGETKPEVEVPEGPPPDELVVEDLVEGDGPVAEPGSLVTVHYVGVGYENGEQFDASWDRGEPFSFQLGEGGVIEGWDEGVAGMRVGGRRKLVAPPDLAYGRQGSPPAIGPNETLVFVIDLLEVG